MPIQSVKKLAATVLMSVLATATLVTAASTFAPSVADARRSSPVQTATAGARNNDHVIEAIRDQSRVHYLEIHDAVVTELLPDDNRGRRHQKWIVEIEDGSKIMAVYNIDLAPAIPLRVGDVMTLGGEFIFDNGGGLIHWLHADPRNRRPDGYVLVNGERYGDLH